MDRNQIIQELMKYFSVKELVCDHVYAKHKEGSWQFLETEYLHCLLVIRRDILKAPMTCNTAAATQRGLRCNLCQLVASKDVPYLSTHLMGTAGDFDVKGMTAEQARQLILQNATKLPCPIRLEKDVTWLHVDTRNHNSLSKVYLFKG